MTNPFLAHVEEDFRAVNDLIEFNLTSDVPLVKEIASYLIKAGGKRLRPLLVLLCARACNYQGVHHVKLAAVIEFLHTAMLLHDDVVDESKLRRGKKTVNAEWGNAASVLVGDFLHSRAFEMMVDIGDIRVMEILSRATNVIAQGEVQQLISIHNPATTEDEYKEIIYRKTAMLFQAAAQVGAVIAGADPKTEKALGAFGLHLGIAFQMVDDRLDYLGSSKELGKNIGDDLAEGKVTLPLIIAMKNGTPDQREFVESVIKKGGVDNLSEIIQVVQTTGALKYTAEQATVERCNALEQLKYVANSKFKHSMTALINFVVERHS